MLSYDGKEFCLTREITVVFNGMERRELGSGGCRIEQRRNCDVASRWLPPLSEVIHVQLN